MRASVSLSLEYPLPIPCNFHTVIFYVTALRKGYYGNVQEIIGRTFPFDSPIEKRISEFDYDLRNIGYVIVRVSRFGKLLLVFNVLSERDSFATRMTEVDFLLARKFRQKRLSSFAKRDHLFPPRFVESVLPRSAASSRHAARKSAPNPESRALSEMRPDVSFSVKADSFSSRTALPL